MLINIARNNPSLVLSQSQNIDFSFAGTRLVSIVSSVFRSVAVIIVLFNLAPALCAPSKGFDFLVHFV